ncbi:MAG: rhamnogalacturonan acetylesterase [Chitinophagales bacterium]
MKNTILLLSFLFLFYGCSSHFDKNTSVIYLAGDSTMSEKEPKARPETGWGEMLGDYFEDGIKIENHAKNGRSSKSFIFESRWDTIVGKLKKNDIVFIQFCHNDSSPTKKERYSTPEEYRKNLIKFVTDTRQKKATPVLFTPVVRRRFNEEGEFEESHGEYPDIIRSIAKEYKVSLIDMQKSSKKALIEMGEDASKKLYMILEKGESANYPDGKEDNTHFSPTGANLMASLAVQDIRLSNLDIKKFLKNP